MKVNLVMPLGMFDLFISVCHGIVNSSVVLGIVWILNLQRCPTIIWCFVTAAKL
jgi:hypothetical protein